MSRVLGLLCIVVGIVAAVYAFRLPFLPATGIPTAGETMPSRSSAPPDPPYIMFSTMAPDTFKRVAMVPVDAAEQGRFVSDLQCDRLYFAAGRGICLLTVFDGLTTKHVATVFDAAFRSVASVSLTGVPSRARVSPDGRRAAVTVFEQGHSYAEEGFSTKTTILDAITGASIGDLEQFTVLRDGVPFKSADFNFWGVTFARDGNRFYATLATARMPYLVEGFVDTRTVRILRAGIECPSLSPDNRRIAYKQLMNRGFWRINVLDLATGGVTSLDSETRSVDDQVDWLDDEHVIYHITGSHGGDVWKLRTDASQPPEMIVPYAYSPSVVR